MYEPICCLLVGDFVKAFSPLIAIGLDSMFSDYRRDHDYLFDRESIFMLV